MSEEADHAGEVTVREAYAALSEQPDAALVDVRTRAEWTFVGVPDLSGIGKEPIMLEWQSFPPGEPAADFVSALGRQLDAAGLGRQAPLYFICRSGQRSHAAAQRMSAAGWTRCFNVTGGFEGPLDEGRHRGMRAGWKAEGLPWIQS